VRDVAELLADATGAFHVPEEPQATDTA